jgi:hypothetical protein
MSIPVLLARGSNSEPAVTVYFSRKVFMITEKNFVIITSVLQTAAAVQP